MSNIAADREKLRQRWYAEGFYKAESIGQTLIRAAKEKPATVFSFHTDAGNHVTTSAEIVEQALKLAGTLQQQGLRPGDVVAVQLPNRYETSVIFVAAFCAGATVLPIVHSYSPAEVAFILRQSKARWLFMRDRWRHIDYLESFERMGALPDLARVVVVGEKLPAGAIAFRSLMESTGAIFTPPAVSADGVCLLLYTSGTTGEPKGVRHSHNTVRSEWEIPFCDNDGFYLNPFPAGHIAGFNFLLRPIVCGVPMIFLEHWDPILAARLIEELKVRQTGGTPFFLNTLLDAARADGRDLSSLKFFGIGATVVTPEQVRFIDDNLCPGGRTYGMTEHSTVTRSHSGMSFEKRAYTDGQVQPGTEVRLVDDNDSDVEEGSEGEILVRGPETFLGYTVPEFDVEAFLPGGWFRTGDIGRLDADGYLTITDRKKDIIIRAGENISSREVEAAIAMHPAVTEVAIVAKPDPKYGERPCAYVILKKGASLNLEDLGRHCEALGLARFKTPEHLVIVNEMPRTAAGKIRKAELRHSAATI